MVAYTTIFDIKRYALHDGPNIRTTVFFKGCPLSCHWCHNPEGIDFKIKIIHSTEKCIGCGECVEQCPQAALASTATGIERCKKTCTSCQECVALCPAVAHEATGRVIRTAELMKEIEKDRIFFDQSGGGVTFSGGEPLSQPDGLLALLKACGASGIHSAVDTSGFAPPGTMSTIARHTDLILFDLKIMDTALHRHFTGVDNDIILHNLKNLAHCDTPVRVRIPLIDGVNDDADNIRATGSFIAGIRNITGVDVLPYHPSARAKYRKLDMKYQGSAMKAPAQETIHATVTLLREYIADVRIGG